MSTRPANSIRPAFDLKPGSALLNRIRTTIEDPKDLSEAEIEVLRECVRLEREYWMRRSARDIFAEDPTRGTDVHRPAREIFAEDPSEWVVVWKSFSDRLTLVANHEGYLRTFSYHTSPEHHADDSVWGVEALLRSNHRYEGLGFQFRPGDLLLECKTGEQAF